jgi:hypothetical protein
VTLVANFDPEYYSELADAEELITLAHVNGD